MLSLISFSFELGVIRGSQTLKFYMVAWSYIQPALLTWASHFWYVCLNKIQVDTTFLYVCLNKIQVDTTFLYVCLNKIQVETTFLYVCLIKIQVETTFLYVCLNKFQVETTGLADPAPVAQTFFVDDAIQVCFLILWT
jgi:hypothetical protein